ncbi:DUF3515 family protein [Motilibacter deserti]|uniref:DUF3515 family protein n=1 Tax=Motilibacter deserti TaxID=2714956 RepID=A0ABX0GV52_9ACTN|nr:DUF3515 family protein [Motilibacter deserti]NHC13520.1 DUF3515 family protein [Motilibacter deserti]
MRHPAVLRAGALAAGLAALALAATGVTAVVRSHLGPGLTPPPVTAQERTDCEVVTRLLPDQVGGLDRRTTRPQSTLTAAWGDPAVTLRCGVREPGPTEADCYGIDGIDWVSVPGDTSTLFVTYGRRPAVEVKVPGDYDAQLLADLGDALGHLGRTGAECIIRGG